MHGVDKRGFTHEGGEETDDELQKMSHKNGDNDDDGSLKSKTKQCINNDNDDDGNDDNN